MCLALQDACCKIISLGTIVTGIGVKSKVKEDNKRMNRCLSRRTWSCVFGGLHCQTKSGMARRHRIDLPCIRTGTRLSPLRRQGGQPRPDAEGSYDSRAGRQYRNCPLPSLEHDTIPYRALSGFLPAQE